MIFLKRITFYPALALLLTLATSVPVLAQNEKQTAYGILVDNTGSLRTQSSQVKTLGRGIVDRIHRRGPISLFHFTTQGDKKYPLAVATAGVEWSQDKNVLGNYINNLWTVPGQTSLYDAVRAVAEKLNAKMDADKNASTDKAIILITDGEDRNSAVTEKQLIKELKQRGIKVYAIGLVRELSEEGGFVGKSRRQKAEDFLKKITKETGGRVVFPKKDKTDTDALLTELFAE